MDRAIRTYPKVANTHHGPPSWQTTDMRGFVCREVMEISVETEDAVNPRCPTWGSNAIHIFSARGSEFPFLAPQMFSLFYGWFRSEASDFEVRFVWKCGCPKTNGFKVRLHFPHETWAYPFQIDPLHILLIRYIPFIYIYTYIYMSMHMNM